MAVFVRFGAIKLKFLEGFGLFAFREIGELAGYREKDGMKRFLGSKNPKKTILVYAKCGLCVRL